MSENVLHAARWKYSAQKWGKKSRSPVGSSPQLCRTIWSQL